MCGVCGFSGPPAPDRLSAMNGLLVHRGPDGDGTYSDPADRMNLAHRRLSIIDLVTGGQPLSNESGTVWVVFNGEIYNYKELRREIEATGRHRFATTSDTETLVHLYEEHGPRFLERLNGMFSLALWDETAGTLLLARDRLGVKPLYWAIAGRRLVFASEMKSILCWPEVARTISTAALSHYLTLRYVPEPLTIYDAVHALPAAHRLTWSPGSAPDIRPYWGLDFTPGAWRNEDELCDRLDELLFDALAVRMRSDVPVGAFLSGGVDSSLVVALMRRHTGAPFHTFSLGYADGVADKQDIVYARRMAEAFGTTHHELLVRADDLAASLGTLVRHFDQPFSGVVSTFFLTGLVKDHVKVALTGDGADDLFASYGHHRLVWPLARLREARRRGDSDPLATADLAPLADRPDHVARFDGREPWELRASFGAFPDAGKARLVATPAGRALAGVVTADFLKEVFASCTATDDLNRMLEVDIKTSLPGEVLFFCDRLSMAHSVELRSPFLDYRVAEFAASVPGTLKIKGNVLKYILKRTAARYLPRDILDRPKEGFVQPNHVWLRRELEPLLGEYLSPAALAVHGLFDPAEVRRMLDEHRTGRADHAFRIWTLVVFQAWHRTYMEEPSWPSPFAAEGPAPPHRR